MSEHPEQMRQTIQQGSTVNWDHLGNRARDMAPNHACDHFNHAKKHTQTWNGGCQLHHGVHDCHKMDERLHVVTAVFNPGRYAAIYRNYRNFEKHMAESGAILHTVELALGDRPFEVTSPCDQRDLQVRGKSQLWLKENLLNLCVQTLPHDWKYVAWIDADITFLRSDWVEQIIQSLQTYDVIQPWSECYCLGPDHEHISLHRSFMRQYSLGLPMVTAGGGYNGPVNGIEFPHPGYAWAMTRNAWNSVGGLLDIGVLGSGDHHMALSLIGQGKRSAPGGISAEYRREILNWQARAEMTIRRNVGFVPGAIQHSWHGRTVSRRYRERWDILTENKYDPDRDIMRNSYGVYEFSPVASNDLRDDIRRYFRNRNDDANSTS